MIQNNKVCSKGNKAIIQSLKRIKNQEPFFLCDNLSCECRFLYNLPQKQQLNRQYPFFKPFQRLQQRQFVFIEDQIRKLNQIISKKSNDYSSIYKKQLLSFYDRIIEQIELQKQQISDIIQQNGPSLYLNNHQNKIYQSLINPTSAINQYLNLTQSLNSSYVSQLNAIRKQIFNKTIQIKNSIISKLYELKSEYFSQFKSFCGGIKQSLNLKIQEKRNQLKQRDNINNLRMLDIIKVEVNDKQIEHSLDTDIDWENVTCLHLQNINNQNFEYLSNKSKRLRQLVIISKITLSQSLSICRLTNLQKISIKLTKNQEEESRNHSYDCDYCNSRRREDDRQNQRQNRMNFKNQLAQTFFQLFKDNPKLKSLTLENSLLNDQVISDLSQLSLEQLNIQNNKNISYQGFNNLCATLSNIQSLSVKQLKQNKTRDSQDSDQYPSYNKRSRNQQLDQAFYQNQPTIKQQRLANFFSLSKLKSLKFDKMNISQKQVQSLLKSFPNLQTLSVDQTLNGDDFIIQLCLLLPNLVDLSINNCYVYDVGLISIAKSLTKLKTLKADNNYFTDNGIIELCVNIPNIQLLSIDNNKHKITHVALNSIIKYLCKLQRLQLNESIQFNNTFLVCVSKLKKLKYLNVGDINLCNSKGIDKLSRNSVDLKLNKIVKELNQFSFNHQMQRSVRNYYDISIYRQDSQISKIFNQVKLREVLKRNQSNRKS